jgi:hypothetical protein
MARYEHLEVYKDMYKFTRELYRLKSKLPQTVKHDLGKYMCQSALKSLRGIVVANGSVYKEKTLQIVLIELETQWVFLRLMYDMRAISNGEFNVISELLAKISPQVQSWIKWENRNPPKAKSSSATVQPN